MKAERGKYLHVTYLNLPKCFDEEIWENSNRIATTGFFTDREDIPKLEFKNNSLKVTLANKELDYDFFGYNSKKTNEKRMVHSDSSYIDDEELY